MDDPITIDDMFIKISTEMRHSILEDKVDIPPNPIKKFSVELGQDELGAAGLSTILTPATKYIIDLIRQSGSPWVNNIAPIFLSIVSEKPGLYLRTARKIKAEYDKTPVEKRKKKSHYVKKVFTETWPTIRADVLYHDTFFSATTYFLLSITDERNPVMAALYTALCFVAGVAYAASMDVRHVGKKYDKQFKKWNRLGFENESYHEVRFPIDPKFDNISPIDFIRKIRAEKNGDLPLFDLPKVYAGEYQDSYLCEHNLQELNGRIPKTRFRQRSGMMDDKDVNSFQIIYTRPQKIKQQGNGQYNLYPIRKDKARYRFGERMVWNHSDIADPKIAKLVSKVQTGDKRSDIRFDRYIARNEDGLYIATDCAPGMGDQNYPYIVEVKVREDLDLQRKAMKYIMQNFNTAQVIDGKYDMLQRCGC